MVERQDETLSHSAKVRAIIASLARVSNGTLSIDGLDAATYFWVAEDSDIDALDIDSLDMLDMIFDLEDQYRLGLVEGSPIEDLLTIGDLANALVEISDDDFQSLL